MYGPINFYKAGTLKSSQKHINFMLKKQLCIYQNISIPIIIHEIMFISH